MPDGSLVPQLIEKPRASRAPKRPEPVVAGLPSIEALARYRKGCNAVGNTLDEQAITCETNSAEYRRHKSGDELLYRRSNSLLDLIATLPARTLPDAVAQIGAVFEILELCISNCDSVVPPDAGDLIRMTKELKKASRLAISILPVITAASGVNPAELVDEGCIQLWDRHYGAIDQVMGDAA